MRHQLEMEAQRRARQMAEDESGEDNKEVEVVAATPLNDAVIETGEMPDDIQIEQPIADVGDTGVES